MGQARSSEHQEKGLQAFDRKPTSVRGRRVRIDRLPEGIQFRSLSESQFCTAYGSHAQSLCRTFNKIRPTGPLAAEDLVQQWLRFMLDPCLGGEQTVRIM